ncbi:MAG: FHA domain-containing protein [Thermodesulfobacteriota bacterium]|nr:FHA domain-containing protein [Thermodesulfobacteriota bacterium]
MTVLHIINGPIKGQSFELTHDIIFIGRTSANDIHIKDMTVSRRHAKISKKEGRLFIEDLQSHNGTRVNGHRINPGEEIEIKEGTSIAVANILIRVGKSSTDKELFDLSSKKKMKGKKWLKIDDNIIIMKMIDDLVYRRTEISVKIDGEKTVFTSKFLKTDKECLFSTLQDRPNLIIAKLVPTIGNTLIQSVSDINVFFSFNENRCRCSLKYYGISSIYSYYGFIVRFPDFIEVEAKQREHRSLNEILGIFGVEFPFE